MNTDVEHITGAQFLAAANRSTRNGADKPAFRQILESLKQFPRTKQRLTFELLAMAWQSLEVRADPGELIIWVTLWSESVEEQRLSEYVESLEKIICRYFDLLGHLEIPPGTIHPFTMTLVFGLTAIRKRNRHRFDAVLDTLRRRCGEAKLDPRCAIISETERRISQGNDRVGDEH